MLIFRDILEKYNFSHYSNYNVCGFSYGAQKAIEYTLSTKDRINNLILLSPAFFNNKNADFINKQLDNFKKNKNIYMNIFLKNCGLNTMLKDELSKFLCSPNFSDLEELLIYKFNTNSLSIIKKRGIKITTFLAQNDKIIDVDIAIDFFREFGIVYFLKNTSHILRKI